MSEDDSKYALQLPTHTGKSQPEGAFYFAEPVEEIGKLISAYSSATGPGRDISILRSCLVTIGVVLGGLFLGGILGELIDDVTIIVPVAILAVIGGFLVFAKRVSSDHVTYLGSGGFMVVERSGRKVAEPEVVKFEDVKHLRFGGVTLVTEDDWGKSESTTHFFIALDEERQQIATLSDAAADHPGFVLAIVGQLTTRDLETAQGQIRRKRQAMFPLLGETRRPRRSGEPVFPIFKQSSSSPELGEIRVGSKGLLWVAEESLEVDWKHVDFFGLRDGCLVLEAGEKATRSVKMTDVGNVLVLLSLSAELRRRG